MSRNGDCCAEIADDKLLNRTLRSFQTVTSHLTGAVRGCDSWSGQQLPQFGGIPVAVVDEKRRVEHRRGAARLDEGDQRAVRGRVGPGVNQAQVGEVERLPVPPHPRSSTAGDDSNSRHRPSAFAAQARLPGPCRGKPSQTSTSDTHLGHHPRQDARFSRVRQTGSTRFVSVIPTVIPSENRRDSVKSDSTSVFLRSGVKRSMAVSGLAECTLK